MSAIWCWLIKHHTTFCSIRSGVCIVCTDLSHIRCGIRKIFLFLRENIHCGYSLEALGKVPQQMFSWRNKKNFNFFGRKKVLHLEMLSVPILRVIMVSVFCKDYECVSKQWRPWSECANVQAGPGLCCLHTKRALSCIACMKKEERSWYRLPLMFSTLGKNFSRQHFKTFFLFLPENRFWHFMQIVSITDNLHEMLKPVFWEK